MSGLRVTSWLQPLISIQAELAPHDRLPQEPLSPLHILLLYHVHPSPANGSALPLLTGPRLLSPPNGL